MILYVGTSGYAYKEWKGKFYPRDLPATQMLRYYSERFSAVEINSTFYRLPVPSVLKAWMSEVPKDFQFAIKSPRRITHIRRLKNAEEPLQEFLKVAAVLKNRLAPLLFGLPPNMKKDLPRLKDFLASLPRSRRAAFEFRHPSWFDMEVFDLLTDHRAALCIADADDELKVPFVATTDWGYVRLRRANYTRPQLKMWVQRIQKQNWRDAYIFFKHEDQAAGPRFAKTFLELAK